MIRCKAAVLVVGVLTALAAPANEAFARRAPAEDAVRWATLRIAELSGSKVVARAEMRGRIMRTFDQADIDGNGVSLSDYELAQRIRRSRQRAQQVMTILRDDLDGDGRVTRAELALVHGKESRRPMTNGGVTVDPTPAQAAKILEDVVARGMKADANADGVITWAEMLSYADAFERSPLGSDVGYEPIPTRLDSDGDGVVTKREFKALIDHAFDAADANRDGLLSHDERRALQDIAPALRREEQEAVRKRRDERRAQIAAAKCGLPKLTLAGKVVFVSVYEGEALSTVSLGGGDHAVTVSRVVVEPGAGALALVLASQRPNIWLVEGKVARVSNVVVAGAAGDAQGVPRVGVVGVPAAKVAPARSTDCLIYAGSGARWQLEREITRWSAQLGRRPDHVYAAHGIATVRVPSGAIDRYSALPNTIAPRLDGPAADVWALLLTYNPKGLVQIDPTSVIAATKARQFAVWPREAGLAQLVERGALEVTGSVGRIRVKDAHGEQRSQGKTSASHGVPKRYTIKRQITIPAGLSGAHAVTFLLPEGVPPPLGEPGHSRIVRRPARTTFNVR